MTLNTLRARLEANALDELYKTYTANRLWEIMEGLYRGRNEVKPYSQIIGAMRGGTNEMQDDRSAQEIRQSIMDKLKGVKAE